MTTKYTWQSGYELQLQSVEARQPISAAAFPGGACEFSLSEAGECRNTLNEVGVSSQGTADSLSRASLAIKQAIRRQIVVDQHNPNKRDWS